MDMRKSRLGKEKQERLMEHFVSGSTARCASELVNVTPAGCSRVREVKTRKSHFLAIRLWKDLSWCPDKILKLPPEAVPSFIPSRLSIISLSRQIGFIKSWAPTPKTWFWFIPWGTRWNRRSVPATCFLSTGANHV